VFGFKLVARWRAVDRHVCARRANRLNPRDPLLLSDRDPRYQVQSAFVHPLGPFSEIKIFALGPQQLESVACDQGDTVHHIPNLIGTFLR
jgi:hypothetical protein